MHRVSIYRKQFKEVLSDRDWMDSLAQLPEDERLYIDRFKKEDDRHCRLIARQLLHKALDDHHLDRIQMAHLKWGKHGKPYLKSAHFNISHSGREVLLAFSLDCELGVDVEKVRKIEHQKFVKQFHEEELKDFEEAKISRDRFFEYWTRKESVIKAIGKGLKKPLIDFQVRSTGLLDLEEDGPWFLTDLDIGPYYKACLCTPEEVIIDWK